MDVSVILSFVYEIFAGVVWAAIALMFAFYFAFLLFNAVVNLFMPPSRNMGRIEY